MKILKNAGTSTLLATWPSPETNANAQMVIEKAGRVPYQSEKGPITPETAHKFITARMKQTHYAVIEHGWRGYIIENVIKSELISSFWPISKYMYITDRPRTGFNGKSEVLVSANLETWRKLIKRGMLDSQVFDGINHDLGFFCPAIFPYFSYNDLDYYFNATPILSVDDLISDEERLSHIAHTTIYDNCSRGLTHELVRQLPPVYGQESTRYVIVMSCNLLERRYIYFRRTSEFAHWEIRKVMCDETRQFQALYPELFKMFIHTDKPAKDGIPGYCTLADGYNAGFFCD